MIIKYLKDKKLTIVFWVSFWLIQSLLMSHGAELSFYLLKNIAIVFLQFVVVQINLKYLFPFFFEKKRYVIYILLSIILVYLVFSVSFILIENILYLYYPKFIRQGDLIFATDFWQILSGSSFYSLALVCSLVFKLLKMNQEKENLNIELKKQLEFDQEKKAIIIKEGHKSHKILISDIYFVKGLKEYVVWYTKTKNIITLQTLNSIENEYEALGFLRTHRSYIVNMNHVNAFERNTLKIKENSIPIGRTYKKNVKSYFE